MPFIALHIPNSTFCLLPHHSAAPPLKCHFSHLSIIHAPQTLSFHLKNSLKTRSSSQPSEPEGEEETPASTDDDWLAKLPEKGKPLYSHSLPCIEAWLKNLGFHQSKDDRAVWYVEKSDWHAQLSLDVTDLYIRYLKRGPGNLDKDIERRFSYALSRDDIENAVLGGP